MAEIILKDVTPDAYVLWEDMCYKNGPLISPGMFRSFMLPRYKQLTGYIRSKGVGHIFLDSDGDCRALIPLWLEGGVTGIVPCEVQAGMDVYKLRQEYGRELLLIGGVDKKALAAGKETIDMEIKKISRTIESGGYVPFFDHGLPHDVSYENIVYFMNELKRIAGGTLRPGHEVFNDS